MTFEALMAHLETLAVDPGYRAPMKKLVDYRDAEVLALPVEEAKVFSDRKRELAPVFAGERCALVVKATVDLGMTNLHGARVEAAGITTRAFRTLDDARAWLEVEVEEEELRSIE